MITFHATISLSAAMLTWTMIAWNAASVQAADPVTRRIIYNDDDGEVKHMATPDIAAMLKQRVRELLGTQVDTVFFNGQQDFAKAFYDSKIEGVEVIGDAGLSAAGSIDFTGTTALISRSSRPARIAPDALPPSDRKFSGASPHHTTQLGDAIDRRQGFARFVDHVHHIGVQDDAAFAVGQSGRCVVRSEPAFLVGHDFGL